MPTRVKKAQVTIFVIIAILIITSVSMLFYLKTQPFAVPAQFKPVEDYFIGCIENKMNDGAALLGSQGGYINLPKFEAGSSYMPFSSQIDFLGTAVPYWFYISGNNIMRQQVPSLQGMEKQLSDFLEEEIKNCDFGEFEDRGYKISMGEARISTTINDESIESTISAQFILSKEKSSAVVGTHKANIKSKIGKFYKIAKKINDKEQKELFLENYSVDVLNLYAPVTGVEISCSPKIWVKNDVVEGLKNALSANIATLKFKGDYYKTKQETDYFIIDAGQNVDENINLLYSPAWHSKIDIWPDEGGVMTAKPVGNQQGLGILGFCYVPYHFVYDVVFPVMIQIYNEKELFQFPVVVAIDKNKARGAVKGEGFNEIETNICNNKATKITVRTFDSNLNPIEADIKFKCFNEECEIGKTVLNNDEAVLEAKMPPCVGSTIIASAPNYSESKMLLDTNEEASALIVMNRLYQLGIDVFVGGAPMSKDETALITFSSGDEVTSISYPEQKTIELKEGYYNISSQVYRKGNLVIGSQKTTQCVKTAAKGIFGFFGAQNEQCYDIEIPSQTLTQIVSGGGSTSEYITEDMLKDSKKLTISASIFTLPKTIFDLQSTYEQVENSAIDIGLS